MSDPFIGEIRMVGFNYAPRGWALCAGQIMSISQNSALFALLGTTFGGNGTTTFALPDYRGRGPVGMGNGPSLTPIVQGEVAGNESTTLNMLQMPTHTHAATATATATSTGTFQVAGASSNPSATPSTTNNILSASGGGPGSATVWSDQLTSPVTLANPEAINTTVNVNVTLQSAGGSQPVGLRNPFLGTNFIIATEGIFPSHN
jgi:microcystin-dependent protein